MLTCGGAGGEPFTLPTEVDGVPHMLMIGPSGMGKSTLLGAMTCAFLQEPNARVFILDVGRSSYVLARCLGADWFNVGGDDSQPLCPLAALDQGEKGLHWLADWFERLFARWPDESGLSNTKFSLGEDELEDFISSLRQCRTPRPGEERVYDLLGLRAKIRGGVHARTRIRKVLYKYVTDYGHIFGGSSESASTARVTVYEIGELLRMSQKFAAPAMELILHSIMSQLDGRHRSWVFIDEFWSVLGDETAADELYTWLRTFRKLNCGIIASSQSLIEIARSPMCGLLIESMPGLILLPNPRAYSPRIRDLYLDLGVSEHETSIIAGSTPHRDFLYTSPKGARLASLNTGPVGQAIYGSTSDAEVQRAQQIWKEHPTTKAFTDAWLRERVPGWQPGVRELAAADIPDGWGVRTQPAQ
jgi:type IV secretion system protein TrbE